MANVADYNETKNHAATCEITERALKDSVRENRIVRLGRYEGVSLESLHADLMADCEGYSDGEGETEYWGVDVDGNEWRVHVEVAS